MNIEQLEYVVEVAKTGSLTRAAENCHVSLSAISQSISQLEAELQLELFTRARGIGAVPTSEGQVILKMANEIVMKVKELKEEAKAYSSSLTGELKIATIPGPIHLLIDAVASFKKEFPNVKVHIFERGPREILHDLTHGNIDIGLLVLTEELMEKYKSLSFERIWEGKMVVGVHAESPLTLEKSITPEKLAKQTLVLYDDEQIRSYMKDFVSQYGELEVLFTTNNVQAIHNALKSGLAVTVGLDYSFVHSADIVTRELEVPQFKPFYYGWVRLDGKHSTHIAKKFINRLRVDM
ncbi:MAG: LysR family transcriptional regulator [Clostridia bacterium]